MFNAKQLNGLYVGQYLSEERNLVINGDCYIDQVNEGASVALVSGTPAYICDGMKASLVTSNSAVVTAQQVTDGPAGLIKSLKLTTSTGAAVAAGDSLTIQIPIEGALMKYFGFGGSTPGAVSIGFWVKTGGNGAVIFSMALQNSAGNRTYVPSNSYKASTPVGTDIISYGAWTYISLVGVIGDIAGTWLTGNGTIGLNLIITVACGSTNQTSSTDQWLGSGAFAANTIDNLGLTTTGATFQVTGIQVEPGPVCTQFSMKPYQLALLDCQRYYEKTFPAGTAPAQNAGLGGALGSIAFGATAGELYTQWNFKVPKAKTPTITTYNPSASNANWRDVTGSSDVAVSVDPDTAKGTNGVFIGSQTTALTANHHAYIHAVADARI